LIFDYLKNQINFLRNLSEQIECIHAAHKDALISDKNRIQDEQQVLKKLDFCNDSHLYQIRALCFETSNFKDLLNELYSALFQEYSNSDFTSFGEIRSLNILILFFNIVIMLEDDLNPGSCTEIILEILLILAKVKRISCVMLFGLISHLKDYFLQFYVEEDKISINAMMLNYIEFGSLLFEQDHDDYSQEFLTFLSEIEFFEIILNFKEHFQFDASSKIFSKFCYMSYKLISDLGTINNQITLSILGNT
jgi:hypothetical protein